MALQIAIPEQFDRDALQQRARDLHASNFNCAQSVACCLAPLLGADEDTTFRLAEGLGGGLATHTETCGALLGGAMVLGLARSNGCADPTSKLDTYRLSAKLVERFRQRFGTTLCGDLRAQDTSGATPLPICKDCIQFALMATVDILEELRGEIAASQAE